MTQIITDVVDIKAFPYVCPFPMRVATSYGRIHIAKGFLSDGASGVPDLCRAAFFGHDKLYLHPVVEVDGVQYRLGKMQCDIAYGQILMRNHRWFRAVLRPIGLTFLRKTHQIWNDYRLKEAANANWWTEGDDTRIVPYSSCWEFPSFYTKDAVWAV